jgi:glycosyltransferase involved in cell wall biosynthesis
MRILYLSQYFPPEVGATQTRAYEMAAGLVRAGHDVTIIAEVPNHPSGTIPPKYRGKIYERTMLDGIAVIRVWVKASPVKNFRNRMAFYLSYMLMAILAGLLLARKKYDVIYSTSPPLFVGAVGLTLSYLRRIPFVFEVRDLWPESAVAMGELQNQRAVEWATKLEEVCYRRARQIVVATDGIRRRLLERGLPAPKITFIPNGANLQIFQPQTEAGKQRRAELGLNGKFVVLYAGIVGVAQGMETIVETARLLVDHRDIFFLVIGEGPKKAEVQTLQKSLKLTNLVLLGEKPQKEMASYFSAGDVALVPLRKLDLFNGALPSKMFEAWACACPVILSLNGEAQTVLENAQAGLHAEPEEAAAIAAAILKLKNEPAARRQMGENGRRFVAENYSRERAAQKLEQLLTQIIAKEY